MQFDSETGIFISVTGPTLSSRVHSETLKFTKIPDTTNQHKITQRASNAIFKNGKSFRSTLIDFNI